MSKEKVITREILAGWRTKDIGTISEELNEYFEKTHGKEHWCDIVKEAMIVWNVMFYEEFDDESPAREVFYAVANQARSGAISAVASALGVKCDDLIGAIEPWYEEEVKPDPIGYVGLEKRMKDIREN